MSKAICCRDRRQHRHQWHLSAASFSVFGMLGLAPPVERTASCHDRAVVISRADRVADHHMRDERVRARSRAAARRRVRPLERQLIHHYRTVPVIEQRKVDRQGGQIRPSKRRAACHLVALEQRI